MNVIELVVSLASEHRAAVSTQAMTPKTDDEVRSKGGSKSNRCGRIVPKGTDALGAA